MKANAAADLIVQQATANLFWNRRTLGRFEIVGVEQGDDDGFITAMIGEPMEPEELESMIEE